MKNVMILLAFVLAGCGRSTEITAIQVPGIGTQDDGSVVRGVAAFSIESEQQQAMNRLLKDLNNLFIQSAYASTATAPVTYNLANAVTFTVNTATLVPGAYNGLSLALGSFTITALKDDDTEVCGITNDQQCVNAYLRVYTTGALAGFVNTSHTPNYSIPMYTSGDNPAVAMVLNSPGTNIKSVLNMAPTKHVVNLVDFVTTNYTVKADFTNGGFGSYNATYVLEYVQTP